MSEFSSGSYLQLEGRQPVQPATREEMKHCLSQMGAWGKPSYAVLNLSNGTYLQCAGSPAGMMVEKNDGKRQYRGHQDEPVVPFSDGTVLSFRAGRISLMSREWFKLDQIADLFWHAMRQDKEPDWIHWRDITDMLARPE